MNRNQLNEIKKKKPHKNLRQFYEKFADKGYRLSRIDFELCLYKDFGKFEIECSGLNNARKNPPRSYGAIIYIWDLTGVAPCNCYMSIQCISFEEYEEALNMIEKAVEKHRKGETIDAPFDGLYSYEYSHIRKGWDKSETWKGYKRGHK